MEFKVEDVSKFLTWKQLGNPDDFGTTFTGRIPADNRFGLEEMDVAISVSHHRKAPQSEDLPKQFENELHLLSHTHHKNIVRLVGYSSSAARFYLVYELVHEMPLPDVIKDLSWEHMLKVLRGLATGLSYLHSLERGPYVLCNICADNIYVTKDFVPKIANFKHCVVEGNMHTGGAVGYYSKKEKANRTSDVLAFGILAIQLLTKACSTTFKVKEGSNVLQKHILDLYVPRFKAGIGLAHPSYGQPLEARKLSEMVIGCLRQEGRVHMTTFQKDLALLCLARQLG